MRQSQYPTNKKAVTPTVNALLVGLASAAALSGLLKLCAAVLTFLLFLTLSRQMESDQFGIFATTFSAATILAAAVSFGQPTSILRFWPALEEKYGPVYAAGAVRYGFSWTLFGAIIALSGGLIFSKLNDFIFNIEYILIIPLVFLAIAMAMGEFNTAVLRARGLTLLALGPRDILWRAILISLLMLIPGPWPAEKSLYLVIGVLIIVTFPQIFLFSKDFAVQLSSHNWLAPYQDKDIDRARYGLWAVTFIYPISQHIGTIVIAVTLGPTAAGAFFAAQRLSNLLQLPLQAINQVVAPALSRSWHGNRYQEVLTIMIGSGLVAGGLAIIGFLVFAVFGEQLLILFDPTFGTAWSALMVLGLGQIIHTICGPNGMLLNMIGHERTLSAILITTHVIGLPLLFMFASLFGIIGAAIGVIILVASWNIAALAKGLYAIRSRRSLEQR